MWLVDLVDASNKPLQFVILGFLGQICSESVFLGSLHSNLAYLKFPQVWTNKSLSELKWERKHDRAGFNPVKNQVLAPCVNSASRSSGMSRSISNNRFSLDNPSFINLHEKQVL